MRTKCAQYIVLVKISESSSPTAEHNSPGKLVKIPGSCPQYPGKNVKVIGRYWPGNEAKLNGSLLPLYPVPRPSLQAVDGLLL